MIRYITGNERLKTATMKWEIIDSHLFSEITDAILGRRATSWSLVLVENAT